MDQTFPYHIDIDQPDAGLTSVKFRNKHISKLRLKKVTDLILIDCYIAPGAIDIGFATNVTVVTSDRTTQDKRIKIAGINGNIEWFETFDDYRNSMPAWNRAVPFEELVWPPLQAPTPPAPVQPLTKLQQTIKDLDDKNDKFDMWNRRAQLSLMWLNIFCIFINILSGSWWVIPINVGAAFLCYTFYKKAHEKFRFGNLFNILTSIKVISDEDVEPEVDTEEEPEEIVNNEEDILEYDA